MQPDESKMAIDDINRIWAEKVDRLSGNVKAIARGDDDFYQQGLLGIRDGLLRDPYATDSYLLQAAKYSITNYRNKGKSIDNGSKHETTKKLLDGTVRTYRKDMVPIYIDKLVSEFQLEFPDYSYAPDILALDKICAERFYRSLDREEAEFMDAYAATRNGDFSDRKTMQKLGINQAEYYRIKRSAYEKFIQTFGTDDQIKTMTGVYR